MFADDDLDRLETDASFDLNLSEAIVKAYRKRIQAIRAAADERDFYGLKSLHYEKLKGQWQHQRSMRLNDQYRLVVEVDGQGAKKVVTIVSIEDYH